MGKIKNNPAAASDPAAASNPGPRALSFAETDECPTNKFTYAFDRLDGTGNPSSTILTLVVEKFHKDMPGDNGSFTACIFDPNDPPQIRVTVTARLDTPGGRAALTLKFCGKDVYSPARELDNVGNGNLGFTELVNLPS
jgi:hypothetical protein